MGQEEPGSSLGSVYVGGSLTPGSLRTPALSGLRCSLEHEPQPP